MSKRIAFLSLFLLVSSCGLFRHQPEEVGKKRQGAAPGDVTSGDDDLAGEDGGGNGNGDGGGNGDGSGNMADDDPAPDDTQPVPGDTITIAAAGDWEDAWEDVTGTNMTEAGKHDLVLLLGDLSYADPAEGQKEANAEDWCKNAIDKAKKPIVFVPGDHDSIAQDGDVTTYANCLTIKEGANGVSKPITVDPVAGNDHGQYPYLYFVDVVKTGVKVRVVATSVAFEETEAEPAAFHKYLDGQYAEDSPNYKWLKNVYKDAKDKGYWLVHINHLPCVDLGKNKSFADCTAIFNLNSMSGVNVSMSGSSHTIWRTFPLKYDTAKCPKIVDEGNPSFASADCVVNRDAVSYKESDGMVQAHGGTGGKSGEAGTYPTMCAANDQEVTHYAAYCPESGFPGIISLSFTAKSLKGDFITEQKEKVAQYAFSISRM